MAMQTESDSELGSGFRLRITSESIPILLLSPLVDCAISVFALAVPASFQEAVLRKLAFVRDFLRFPPFRRCSLHPSLPADRPH